MINNVSKFVYWSPRVLSIAFICFLALFSLDVVSPELSLGQIALGLFMHNIPVFILIAILIISWKREIVGGIAYILAGLMYILLIFMNVFRESFQWYMISWILIISGPAFLIGILFMVNWNKRKEALGKLVK